MPDNPISNPGVTPTPPTPPESDDRPGIGANDPAQEPKPFSLNPEPLEGGKAAEVGKGEPSPMELAGEMGQQKPVTPESLGQAANKLVDQLDTIHDKLQDSNVTNKLTDAHFEAMNKVMDKMNPDMRSIADKTGQKFTTATPKEGQGALDFAAKWVDQTQGTMANALQYLAQNKNMTPGQQLSLQYTMQRASQKSEIFINVIGAGMQGIKTIMSTQLG